MKMISGMAIGSVMLMALFAACSKKEAVKTDDPNSTDDGFVIQVAYTHRAAIILSELAMFRSTNDSVKVLAQYLISGHTTAMNSLSLVAAQYNYQLPSEMDTVHKAFRSQLNSLNGRSFDSAYVNGQVSDLQRVVNLFDYEKRVGNAPPIKSYAENILPTMQLHLQRATDVINDL
ncbi:MAG: DUF4142 domain-containing protein [Chitinophagaceae bacterium]|nr:DUF4142 domain-containing protein [Chitinophagaceae bacterium]